MFVSSGAVVFFGYSVVDDGDIVRIDLGHKVKQVSLCMLGDADDVCGVPYGIVFLVAVQSADYAVHEMFIREIVYRCDIDGFTVRACPVVR